MNRNKEQTEKKTRLVDYVDKNLPPLRLAVEMIPVTHEAREMIYVHDPEGYVEKPFVLDKEIVALLPLLNGNYSIRDIRKELQRYGSDVEELQLLEFVRQLDNARLLLSPWFHHYRESVAYNFENSSVRPPVCAGQSYPSDPTVLKELLAKAFASNGKIVNNGKESQNRDNRDDNGTNSAENNGSSEEIGRNSGKVKALFAPHIDLRVGMQAYIPAFRPLAELRPTRVVLLATSHYAGMFHPVYDGKPFIATRKNFETPFGTVPTDQRGLDEIQGHASSCGCSFQDRAHRNEHSIELHLIFLQHLWSHRFQLIPLLVGSLEELYYQKSGDIGKKVETMAALLGKLYGDDEDTLFLISGDLAHVGLKFGDRHPASKMFDEVKSFDRTFLEGAQKGNSTMLLELMKQAYDPYRMCGFPPLYTALTALSGLTGTVTSYELWDEREQESAVTFGSLLYRQNS